MMKAMPGKDFPFNIKDVKVKIEKLLQVKMSMNLRNYLEWIFAENNVIAASKADVCHLSSFS